MTERNLSIRLSVEDADKVRRELAQVGEQGAKALADVAEGATPTASALAGVETRARAVQKALQELVAERAALISFARDLQTGVAERRQQDFNRFLGVQDPEFFAGRAQASAAVFERALDGNARGFERFGLAAETAEGRTKRAGRALRDVQGTFELLSPVTGGASRELSRLAGDVANVGDAFGVLSIATRANPFLAVVTGAGLAVGAVLALSSATKAETSAEAELAKALDASRAAVAGAAEASADLAAKRRDEATATVLATSRARENALAQLEGELGRLRSSDVAFNVAGVDDLTNRLQVAVNAAKADISELKSQLDQLAVADQQASRFGGAGSGGGGGSGDGFLAVKKQVEALRAALDPLVAATQRQREQEILLAVARAEGVIDLAEYNRLIGDTSRALENYETPIQAATRALEDEARVLAAAPAQRALVRAAIEAENEARRLGLNAEGREKEKAELVSNRLTQARGREADAAKQALAEIELETQGLAALAAAYGESEEAALRQIAANQAAAQAAKSGAVDQAALRDALLRRDAARLAEGSGRRIADRERDVAGLEAVAAAEASGGPAAAAEIERQNKVAAEAAKLRTAANVAGSDAIREKLFAEIAALEQLSKSEADAARERQSAQVLNARREELALLQAELALQNVSDAERGRRLELLRVELDLKRRGIKLTSDQERKEIELAGRIGETRGELQRIADQREAMRDLTRVISTGFEDAVVRGKNLREVVQGILQDLARIAFRASVTKPLENALTGSGGGSDLLSGALGFLGGLFGVVGGAADGAVFDRRGLVPFARGGVVRRPTVFPFESGVGLMGEAGPEAIMPLRRLPSGRLGVEAANNGSRAVVINQTVNITVQGGGQGAPGGGLDPETIQRLGATLRRETEAAVDRRIQELLRPGNALNPSF